MEKLEKTAIAAVAELRISNDAFEKAAMELMDYAYEKGDIKTLELVNDIAKIWRRRIDCDTTTISVIKTYEELLDI